MRYGPQTKVLLEIHREESGGSLDGSLLGMKPTGLQDLLKRLARSEVDPISWTGLVQN